MGGVGVGVQQADGDGFRRRRAEAREEGRKIAERRLDAAIGADALGHAEARIALDQAGEWIGGEAVDVAARVARDLEHVLEAGGGEQHAAGELAFEHGVGGDGRAVQQQADIGQREAEAGRGLPHAGEKTLRRVGGRCRGLPRDDAATARIEDLQVGEGAADIDRDADGAGRVGACHAESS